MRYMDPASRHLSVQIDRPVNDVYAYAADPANLPRWAVGLGNVVQSDGRSYVETGGGVRLAIRFAPLNDFGVLDHWVTQPDGQVVYIPFRVFADGERSEAVFTLRRGADMSDADFDRDAGLVTADLARLKDVLEHQG